MTLQNTSDINTFKLASDVFIGFVDENVRAAKNADLLEGCGWIPHRTIPHEIVGEVDYIHQASPIIIAYAIEHWSSISKILDESVTAVSHDRESLAVFRRALAFHADGAYGAVAQTLMPEMERITRNVVYGGLTNYPASLEEAIVAIARLPGECVLSHRHGVRAYRYLREHTYRNMKNDPVAHEEVRRTPVPNRHAAAHGYASYDQFENSFNALVMFEFFSSMMRHLSEGSELGPTRGPHALSTVQGVAYSWQKLHNAMAPHDAPMLTMAETFVVGKKPKLSGAFAKRIARGKRSRRLH